MPITAVHSGVETNIGNTTTLSFGLVTANTPPLANTALDSRQLILVLGFTKDHSRHDPDYRVSL
jgi:hypothetical protein